MISRIWIIGLFVGFFGVLSACNQSEQVADTEADASDGETISDEAKASQVIAKVGKTEITVHQLNVEMAQLGNVEDMEAARRQALAAIVYRTALSQAAIDGKLDRDPAVMIQTQAVKDKVLAEAYLRSQTATTPPPTVTEVDDYMLQHPMMFDKRRLYDFERVVLPIDAYRDEFVPLFEEKEDFVAFEARLKELGVNYNLNEVRVASGQFPEQMQGQLPNYKEGDTMVVRSDATVAVMRITGWTDAPLPRERGRELAKAVLFQSAVKKRAESTREQVIAKADITFEGEFKDIKLDLREAAEEASGAEDGPADQPVVDATAEDKPEGQ